MLTIEEAKERGIIINSIAHRPTMTITAPPQINMMEHGEYKTGRAHRRERRKKERKLNKK